MTKNALIFGSTGSIGSYIFNQLKNENYNVIGTTSNINNVNDNTILVTNTLLDNLKNICNVNIVIWSQGYNFNDNIYNFDCDNFYKIMDGNVSFILNSCNYLLKENKINEGAKLVIISSIWQDFSRENKLSYSISKSALSGLVKNLSNDLSNKNILINNILPGVVDNEMTNKTLTETELNYIKQYLKFNRLINMDDIYRTVKFLAVENTGITGQSICVDLGFTSIRKYS